MRRRRRLLRHGSVVHDERVDGEKFSRGYERGKWKMYMVPKKTGNKRGTGGSIWECFLVTLGGGETVKDEK